MIAVQIGQEVWHFVITLYWGMIFSAIYDSIRLARRVVRKFHTGMMAAEDIVYWICISLWTFRILYELNDGKLRAFLIVGFFAGAKLYHDAIGTYFLRYGTRFLNFLRKLLKKWIKPITIKHRNDRNERK